MTWPLAQAAANWVPSMDQAMSYILPVDGRSKQYDHLNKNNFYREVL